MNKDRKKKKKVSVKNLYEHKFESLYRCCTSVGNLGKNKHSATSFADMLINIDFEEVTTMWVWLKDV